MSKKYTFGALCLILIVGVALMVKDATIASSAITAISLIGLAYIGGQSGVDGVSKFKNG